MSHSATPWRAAGVSSEEDGFAAVMGVDDELGRIDAVHVRSERVTLPPKTRGGAP